jgi:hypothetical protein
VLLSGSQVVDLIILGVGFAENMWLAAWPHRYIQPEIRHITWKDRFEYVKKLVHLWKTRKVWRIHVFLALACPPVGFLLIVFEPILK